MAHIDSAIPGRGRGLRASSDLDYGVEVCASCESCRANRPITTLAGDIGAHLCEDELLASAADSAPFQALLKLCDDEKIRFPAMALKMASEGLQHPLGFNAYWKRVLDLRHAARGPEGLHPIHQTAYEHITGVLETALGQEPAQGLTQHSYTPGWMARLIGTLELNSMRCGQTACSVLFHTASLFNHSCSPNVGVDWVYDTEVNPPRAASASFKTLRPVRSGEELCITYHMPPDGASTTAREAATDLLRGNYGIDCGRSCQCYSNMKI